MKRAFLSLYLLIVLATLGLGWALDQLWNAYQPEQHTTPPGATLTKILQLASEERELDQTRNLIHAIASRGLADVRLVPLEEISGTSMVERLKAGEPLSFETSEGGLYHYQKLPDHPQVVVIAETDFAHSQRVESLLAVLFYVALAAVVFFWLWPLTRDLTRLERHAEALGRNPEYPQVKLQGHSAAQRLARAFNHMANRIRDLLRSQKEMTHAVSHELRTPLARMKFALEMAQGNRNPEDLQYKLAGLQADVAEMDQLVNQLLHYARFEQEPELHPTAGDMPGLIRDLSHRLSGHLHQPARIELVPQSPENNLEEQSENSFVCDWQLMERALHNLLQNALRHARQTIEVHLYANQRGYRIEIDDDGPGVPEGERGRIFESFVRLRESPEHHAVGFGLGLAIVQRIMQWHRGEVRVEQAPLGGARFVLEWPRQAVRRQ